MLNVRKDEFNEADWTDIPPADEDHATSATTTADAWETRQVADTTAVDMEGERAARADTRTAPKRAANHPVSGTKIASATA